jgi:hypothetical protein
MITISYVESGYVESGYVEGAPMAIEIVTFDELKTFLGLEGTTEAEYPALTQIKTMVTGLFEDYTGRIFARDDYTETLIMNSIGTRMISLKAIPILTVASVTINGVVTTDYEIKDFGLELGYKVKDATIEVTYRGGIVNIPRNLNRAAVIQCAYEFQHKDSVGLQTFTTDGGSVIKNESGMLKQVEKLLQSELHPLSYGH